MRTRIFGLVILILLLVGSVGCENNVGTTYNDISYIDFNTDIKSENINREYAHWDLYFYKKDKTVKIVRRHNPKMYLSASEQNVPETIEIPSTIAGYTVTGLCDSAFLYAKTSIKKVIIPDTVTEIVGNPFAQCTSLETIVVSPEHPNLATIDGVLFDKNEKKLICFPAGKLISSYSIPNGIKAIGIHAFDSCSLTEIIIPESVTEIGSRAFARCLALNDLIIPKSVNVIGSSPFYQCKCLNGITIEKGNPAIQSDKGVIYSIPDSRIVYCPPALTGEYEVLSGTKLIDADAFAFSQLSKLTIPAEIAIIKDRAFQGTQMENIIFQGSPQVDVGDFAFYLSTKLKRLGGDYTITSLGDGCFYCCYNFEELPLLSSDIQSLGFSVFEATALSNVTLSDAISSIGESTFSRSDISSITLPDALKVIQANTFSQCKQLKTVLFPKGLEAIEDSAFADCESLETVVFPGKLKSIGKKAFSGCGALHYVTIPSSVKQIADDAFPENPTLTFIVEKNSYSEKWCINNKLSYAYEDPTSWLNG